MNSRLVTDDWPSEDLFFLMTNLHEASRLSVQYADICQMMQQEKQLSPAPQAFTARGRHFFLRRERNGD
jgi:hypothetical protein